MLMVRAMAETTASETFEEKWKRLANVVSNRHNADVIIYSGDIEDGTADRLIKIAREPKRKKNVVLMLTTRGGSPDAAYRMARCLQRQYTKIILFIYGICKSSGTLVSVGAHEIILSDFGEFGPLDIQLGKRDELFEQVSGLNITQALNSLNTRAQDMFRDTLIDLKRGSRGQLSTKLAAEIASNLAIGLYEKIYAQIDPAQLGAIERSIHIASDYGERLKTKNVKLDTIDRLVGRYSSHSFVIDIVEAKDLFENVRMPDGNEEELAECIAWVLRDPAGESIVQKLNTTEEERKSEQPAHTTTVEGANGTQPTGGTDNTPAPEAALSVVKRTTVVD
jgi:hypothetical protein